MKLVKIKLKSFNYKLMDKFINDLKILSKNTKSIYLGPIFLPIKFKKFDLLRSPHVDKNSRDQFEIRTYQRLFYLFFNKSKMLNILMKLNSSSEINIKFKLI